MFNTISVIIMCIIAVGAGIFGWWIDNAPERKDDKDSKKEDKK